jgi:hypothetical protein
MLENTRRCVAGIGALALAAGVLAFAPPEDGDGADAPDEVDDAAWHIEATGARIIGGYGDNFAYDGSDVRPIEGRAVAELNPEEGTGKVRVEIRTTDRSGPVHFSKDTKWEGEIEIVQRLNTGKMDQARIAQDVFLHGDTGREAPVMPKIYNYFATWGPSKITVNGEEAVPMIGSHTMFSEQSRGEDGRIAKGGTVYHPMKVDDKTGFTNPDELEFHFVAHTSEQDKDNFPPHTAWIHLHFDDVEVKSKPAGIEIPYDTRQARAGD